MRPPCETIVSKILPAMRALLVKDLIDRHNLSQKETAEKLGVTQAAVSQYISSARGAPELEKEIENSSVDKKIRDLSDKIAEENPEGIVAMAEYCEICNLMKKDGIICKVHGEVVEDLPETDCSICTEE